jgi:hypothetical protein
MKRKLATCLFVMLLAGQGALNGQQAEASMRPDVFFAKTVIHLRDGSVLYGFLSGLEPEALIIRQGPNDSKVSSKEITKIVLSADKSPGRFMMIGAIAGLYLGNLIFNQAANQPTAFMTRESYDSTWEAVYVNTIFAAGGIGLGFLASLFENSERVFSFDADPGLRQAEWQRFRDFVSGTSRPRRVHVYLQAAQVFPSATGLYEEAFRQAGYSESSGYYSEPASHFNLLRGLRLTWTIKTRFEVGAAVLSLSEPTVGGYQYSSGSRQIGARFDSTGYFLVGSFDALAGRSAKSARWKVGVGAGAAQVDFGLNFAWTQYYPYRIETASYSMEKSLFCPLLFTELQVPITVSLSVGIYADYVPAPSQSIPAFPEWDLPAQQIRLVNGSIGATLGLHF